ncbi:Ribonuclease CAF1 [Penicillium verhagenii]|uniref:Ribonuclease CAF1 n=1 Tax=Penicillium verhagenii TaxID=1562060 RepID=UPI00254596BF|nr:Ribonuclease CAF1 [Penicillium verhagenii]KAJ5918589.1 Ribonuclease CAF1 [Penicillium verhagenii]
MDVTAASLPRLLPWILHQISRSSFVAIDLEFSGISIVPTSEAKGNLPLQEQYLKMKAAAEKYQVLQIGLTICEEDVKNATYTMAPYNITLSPFIDRTLDIKRDWTFMSWSMEFLMGHNFSMDSLCKYGVRYLSRDEEAESVAKARHRFTRKNSIATLELTETDKESIDFLGAVRRIIDWWLAQPARDRMGYLNIPSHTYAKSPSAMGPGVPSILNSMEKRLVHNLVNAEFPQLKSKGKASFIQIMFADPVHDKDINEEKAQALIETIRGHVGCRWIIEALIGGDLSELPDKTFSPIVGDGVPFGEVELAQKTRERLQKHRPILVGHNCFLDLLFLYSGFIGPLPDTVEEFQMLIHGLFPNVVDTKYLATSNAGSINPTSSLEEISRRLLRVSVPAIAIDPMHQKYAFRTFHHEAGYDSMLSAIPFMKLSVQLEKGQTKLGAQGCLSGMELAVASEVSQVQQVERWMRQILKQDEDATSQEMEDLDLIEFSDDENPKPKQPKPAQKRSAKVVAKTRTRDLVPELGTEFWRVYGNKLRVFGTVERVVHLD